MQIVFSHNKTKQSLYIRASTLLQAGDYTFNPPKISSKADEMHTSSKSIVPI
jgi:hypothetical protein